MCQLGCAGCPYSFTGASVPPHIKTISISLFDDQSGFGEPDLRERLTGKLIERFVRDNTLEVTDKTNADSNLEGVILSVQQEPAIMEKGETVTKYRVTIAIKVTYEDNKLKKKVWEKQFSNWGIYEIEGGPESRQIGINDAIEKISEDILLETVSGW